MQLFSKSCWGRGGNATASRPIIQGGDAKGHFPLPLAKETAENTKIAENSQNSANYQYRAIFAQTVTFQDRYSCDSTVSASLKSSLFAYG